MIETTETVDLAWRLGHFWLESTQPSASWSGARPTRFTLTFRGNTLADKRGFNWASYSKQNVSPRRTLFAEQLSGFIHERMFKGAVGPLAWERGRRLLWCTPPAIGSVGPLWLALR